MQDEERNELTRLILPQFYEETKVDILLNAEVETLEDGEQVGGNPAATQCENLRGLKSSEYIDERRQELNRGAGEYIVGRH